ncbi:hypothetical protein ElyMa_001596400, partial [Elysia marginata]
MQWEKPPSDHSCQYDQTVIFPTVSQLLDFPIAGLDTDMAPAQWKASADEDDKRRLGVITSRNGPEWHCTNWSGQPQTEMHGDRKLLLLPSDPPDDPTGRGTEV